MKITAKSILILIIFSISIVSCKHFTKSNRVIVIQPFEDFPPTLTTKLFNELNGINGNVILKPAIELPKEALYAPRNRYKANKLIAYLSNFGSADSVIIALTNKDISTKKGDNPDSGIMGLGYCPGNSCVVSTFRLRRKNLSEQFIKLAQHELGHTQGLKHCVIKSCLMRDAEGKNVFDEEKGFCNSCKSFLVKKGWKLA